MKSYAAFILSHENFADSLKATVEKITGSQKNLFPYSNKTDTLQILAKKIDQKISELNVDKIFVFVDLIGGSCWGLANMLLKQRPNIVVIGGVNMPMIISLIINFENYNFEDLLNKILEDSKKGIKAVRN